MQPSDVLLTLQAALDAYARHIVALPSQSIPLVQALGHVLAGEVRSLTDLPPFTQSAVDGYAVRSADGIAPLRLVDEVAAGALPHRRLHPGEAVRIFTGATLPEGADAVARQEIVRREETHIRLGKVLASGVDVRQRGEEMRSGAVVAAGGQRLVSGLVGALAMAGVDHVPVRPRPRVAVLITGDEVVQPGGKPSPGCISDANGPLIGGWLAERGYGLVRMRYVPDVKEALVEALQEAAEAADLVISTGGVSAGDRDHTPAAAERCGYRRVFWKLAQKPGKPLWFGMRGNQPLLALPGNPGAVLVGLHVHAACILGLLEGMFPAAPRWRRGRLAVAFPRDSRSATLVRVRAHYDEGDGAAVLHILPGQNAHMLSNLAEADGLAWIPAGPGELTPRGPVLWVPLV